MELKTELILLCGSRICTLSALLWDIGEAIRPLLIKGDGFARLGTDREPLTGTSPKSGGTSTQRDTSFQLVPDFRAASEPSNNFTPIICVTFCRERTVSVNFLLDNGSCRIYLSGYVLQFLGPIDSVGLGCYLRLTTLLGECEQRVKGGGFGLCILLSSVKQLGLSVWGIRKVRMLLGRAIQLWYWSCPNEKWLSVLILFDIWDTYSWCPVCSIEPSLSGISLYPSASWTFFFYLRPITCTRGCNLSCLIPQWSTHSLWIRLICELSWSLIQLR